MDIPTADLLLCPICDGRDFDDLDVGPQYPAVLCRRCRLGVERRLPSTPFAYTREGYDRAREHGQSLGAWGRFHHDYGVSVLRLAALATHLPVDLPSPRLWLDVGCGAGALLVHLRRRGWRVAGVEAAAETCRELGDHLAIPALPFGAWSGQATGVDPARRALVVSLFDLIEHLYDPIDALRSAAAWTQDDGLVVVEVPDLDQVLKDGADFATWKHRRISEQLTEHVWHFTRDAFEALTRRYLSDRLCLVECATVFPGRLRAVWRKKG